MLDFFRQLWAETHKKTFDMRMFCERCKRWTDVRRPGCGCRLWECCGAHSHSYCGQHAPKQPFVILGQNTCSICKNGCTAAGTGPCRCDCHIFQEANRMAADLATREADDYIAQRLGVDVA